MFHISQPGQSMEESGINDHKRQKDSACKTENCMLVIWGKYIRMRKNTISTYYILYVYCYLSFALCLINIY